MPRRCCARPRHVEAPSQVVREAGGPAADRGRHVARPAEAGVDRDEEKREPEHRGSRQGDADDGDAPEPVLHDERTQPGEQHEDAAAVGTRTAPAERDEREETDGRRASVARSQPQPAPAQAGGSPPGW